MLVREEKIDEIKEIVHSVAKELSRKGIMFALPVTFWEGLIN